jgi:hypothetical protein
VFNSDANKVLDSYSSYGQLSIVSNDLKRQSMATSTSAIAYSDSNSDLFYYLDRLSYTNATSDNSFYALATSSAGIPVFLFARKHTNGTDGINITWNGQSTVGCGTNAIYLHIYNVTASAWESIATSTGCTADTDFNLTPSLTSASDYYDASNWNYVRVYQASGTQTLKTDYINLYVPTAVLAQRAYIFENDDGNTVNSNSDMDSANTTTTNVRKGQRFTVRFQIDNSGTLQSTQSYKVQFDKNDSQWTESSLIKMTANGLT